MLTELGPKILHCKPFAPEELFRDEPQSVPVVLIEPSDPPTDSGVRGEPAIESHHGEFGA